MIELTAGQELALASEDGAPLAALTLGLAWDRSGSAGFLGTGAPEIDLDLAAIQFAGGALFDLAVFNHPTTRDGSVVHRGDNRSGRGEGDDEQITVDLASVHGPVDTIFVLVTSYQGHALEWINRAYCRVLDQDGAEVARVRLTGGVAESGVVVAALTRDGAAWRLRVIGEGIAAKVATEAIGGLARFLRP